MREFQERQEEKNKIKRRLFSKTTLFFMFFIVIILGRGAYGVYEKHESSKRDLERLNAEYGDIEKRYEEISMKGKRLESSDGVELELRGKYDITKPNEKVVIVVEDEQVPAPAEEVGVLRRMWNKMKGVFR